MTWFKSGLKSKGDFDDVPRRRHESSAEPSKEWSERKISPSHIIGGAWESGWFHFSHSIKKWITLPFPSPPLYRYVKKSQVAWSRIVSHNAESCNLSFDVFDISVDAAGKKKINMPGRKNHYCTYRAPEKACTWLREISAWPCLVAA